MQRYIIIGDSGHSKVVEECILAQGGKIVAKLDDCYNYKFIENQVFKGPISLVKELLSEKEKVIIAIGSNTIRKKIVQRLNIPLHKYGIVIHPRATISDTATLGLGTVVMPGAIVNSTTIIGNFSIVNTNCVVEHDCILGDYVHISPGAVLTGNVKVGEGTQIGAGATVIPGIEIGCWSIIGAGSSVISKIRSNITAVGSPAKVIQKEGF